MALAELVRRMTQNVAVDEMVARNAVMAWFDAGRDARKEAAVALASCEGNIWATSVAYRILIGTHTGGHGADTRARRLFRTAISRPGMSSRLIDRQLEEKLVYQTLEAKGDAYMYAVGALGKAFRPELTRWRQEVLELVGNHPKLFAHTVASAEIDQAKQNRTFLPIEEALVESTDPWGRARDCVASGNAAIVCGAGVAISLTTPNIPHAEEPLRVQTEKDQIQKWIGAYPSEKRRQELGILRKLGGDEGRAPLWGQLVRRVVLMRTIHPRFGILNDEGVRENDWFRDLVVPLLDANAPLEHVLDIAERLSACSTPYRPALARVLRHLEVRSSRLGRILDRVCERGSVPVLTVNYDSLITDVLADRTPTSHVELLEHLDLYCSHRGGDFRSLFVAHLHGRDTDLGVDRGFSLTEKEYMSIESLGRFVRFCLPLFTSHSTPSFGTAPWRSLVFVGCGGTLGDNHFDALWFALRKLSTSAPQEHFVILREQDHAVLDTLHQINQEHGIILTPLVYPSHLQVDEALFPIYTPAWKK